MIACSKIWQNPHSPYQRLVSHIKESLSSLRLVFFVPSGYVGRGSVGCGRLALLLRASVCFGNIDPPNLVPRVPFFFDRVPLGCLLRFLWYHHRFQSRKRSTPSSWSSDNRTQDTGSWRENALWLLLSNTNPSCCWTCTVPNTDSQLRFGVKPDQVM